MSTDFSKQIDSIKLFKMQSMLAVYPVYAELSLNPLRAVPSPNNEETLSHDDGLWPCCRESFLLNGNVEQ